MQLGISSFTYGWNIGFAGNMPERPMNEIDLVHQTVAFGLNCLQIGDNLPLQKLNKASKEQLKNELTNNHIRLEIGARKLDSEHLEECIALAVYFQSPLLRFIIDGNDYEPGTDVIISVIEPFLPQLADNNIILGIENHDRLKAAELAEMIESIDHANVGICLDCVNSMGAGEGLEQVVSLLAPHTVNLHIKDYKIERLSHNMGFIIDGEIAGKGMLDVNWLLSKIKNYNRCKSAVLEQWVPPEADNKATCEKEKRWAEESIHYLQSVFK
jgi:sugar phosphate isomerase/epimerase